MRFPNPFRREQRDEASTLENPDVDVITGLTGEGTDGSWTVSVPGVVVTPSSATRLTAVYACVRAISESCASLPIPIYATRGRSRERLVDDPRWTLLNDSPNPEMTAMQLMEGWIAHALLWGRGYLYISGVDQTLELWPMRPDRTRPRRTATGELFFETILDTGERVQVPADRVIELESLLGDPPVRLARGALGVAMAAEEYAARFWSNNARPGGVIETDANWNDQTFEEFKERWRSGHEGLKRAQLVGILSGGAHWKDVGIAPELAQFIQSREFSVREVARLFRVPPHIIGDLQGTVSRASIETQSIEFVTYSLRPWLVRAEQALKLKLFASQLDQANKVYPEFLVAALLRGDTKSRYESYALGIQWGFLSRADVRELENLPEVAGAALDEFLVPLNMAPSGVSLSQPGGPLENASANLLSLLMRNHTNGS